MSVIGDIKIKNLAIGYDFPLIEDINLHLTKGELVALIGKNGVGKSTLLKTISGFMPSVSGKLEINDIPITKYSKAEFARKVSIVTTERLQIANYKVVDLIAFGRFPYSSWLSGLNKEDKTIIDEAIDKVKIGHLKSKYINQLSDGEFQRAMIARCLAQDTDIILMDEPTAFLDLPGKYEIVSFLKELAHSSGKLIIFSTHDLNLAIRFATELWLINNNKLITGSPEDIILNNDINSIFEDSILDFNPETGDFDITSKNLININLSGEGIAFKWTKSALEKQGYNVALSDIVPKVIVEYSNKTYHWKYVSHSESKEFNSIKKLSLYMKQLIKPDKL